MLLLKRGIIGMSKSLALEYGKKNIKINCISPGFIKSEMTEKINDNFNFLKDSALNGDNVVNRSNNMSWYEGSTLLHTLENVHIASDHNHIDCRFPVQYVVRPQKDEFHDFRGYAGRIAGGVFKIGDDVTVLPSGFQSKIKSIETFNGSIDEAYAPMSITLILEDDIDVSRGDMIVRPKNQPKVIQDVEMMLCWMSETPLINRGKYTLKHTSKEARCMIKDIQYKVDINTLHRLEDDKEIKCNDIAKVTLRVTQPLFADQYKDNRSTGSVIIIDEATNNTVGAGMIV